MLRYRCAYPYTKTAPALRCHVPHSRRPPSCKRAAPPEVRRPSARRSLVLRIPRDQPFPSRLSLGISSHYIMLPDGCGYALGEYPSKGFAAALVSRLTNVNALQSAAQSGYRVDVTCQGNVGSSSSSVRLKSPNEGPINILKGGSYECAIENCL